MLSFDAVTDYESYKDKRVVVTGANLFKADLSDAILNGAKMPDGTIHE